MKQHDPASTARSTVPASRFKRGLRTAAIYTLIFVTVSFAANLWLTRNQTSGPAPRLVGHNLQGERVSRSLSDLERPVLVYFFAEWCPICKVQHAAIRRVANSYPVLAVAMQSGDTDNVRQYVQQAGLDMPVINDVHGATTRAYRVNGVPASFIVDRQGNIAFSTRGYATQAGLSLRLWLTEREWL